MSYDAIEATRDGGKPYFMYEFVQGPNIGRFTSRPADATLTRDQVTDTFTPAAISHGKIVTGGDAKRDSLDITLPLSDNWARGYTKPSSPLVTTVSIWRAHEGEPEPRIIFRGRVKSAKPQGQTIALVCSSEFSSLRHPGLGKKLTRGCQWVLYDDDCGVSRDAFRVTGTATSIDGLTLTITGADGQNDNYFRGGIIEYDGAVGFITRHKGTSITTRTTVFGLEEAIAASAGAGVSVDLFPGCNRAFATCRDKFGNNLNFGGFHKLPNSNPFDGSSIA